MTVICQSQTYPALVHDSHHWHARRVSDLSITPPYHESILSARHPAMLQLKSVRPCLQEAMSKPASEAEKPMHSTMQDLNGMHVSEQSAQSAPRVWPHCSVISMLFLLTIWQQLRTLLSNAERCLQRRMGSTRSDFTYSTSIANVAASQLFSKVGKDLLLAQLLSRRRGVSGVSLTKST